ncbi:DUF7344 domain-containing protein [Halostagnicola kamekurae]|uniref:DUF7344 domain-containing protein n=1 Tax=Halostagnicola kamekurae TaxID=619731 RepID=A0A1I6NZG7_9EURY|nr:hypothetical protein [Halostagnicola kamekurae]SFS33347.1 hypothetical protein SAMN04488556_0224 [Halostagnicola kamekurae]
MKIPHPTTNRVSPAAEPGLESLTLDTLQRVLNSRRRRAIIRYVLAAGESVTVTQLVRAVSESENDPTLETTFLERCQRVHDSLSQTHLPTLEEHGIVEYERGVGRVSPAAHLLTLEPYVGPGSTDDEP